MFWWALALSVVLLLTTPRVVHAGSVTHGLCLAGVSTSLLIYQNGIFGADAALSKLRKFFKRGTGTEGDEESEAMLPAESSKVTLPKNVKKAYDAAVMVWLDVFAPDSNMRFVKHLHDINYPGDDNGEKAVRAILRWRSPGPDRPHPLDAILPVGGEMKLLSLYNNQQFKIKRVAGNGTELPVCNVIYPMLGGEVSIHRVEVSEDMLKNPESLEAALHLVHQRVEPPLVGDSPAKRQKEVGLLTALDMFTIPRKVAVVPRVRSPGKILFNMFLVTSAVQCSLREFLLDLEKYGSNDESKRTARRAKLSVTVQMITILSKLRDLGLVPPPVTTGSFVLNGAGKVFLNDFAPLLQQNKRYVKLPGGLIVSEKVLKRLKGKVRATPYPINNEQVITDLLSMIFEMWCRPRGSGGHSDTTTSTTASSVDHGGATQGDFEEGTAAGGATGDDSGEGAVAGGATGGDSKEAAVPGGATGGDSEEGAATAAVTSLALEDFDCEDMPQPLYNIVEMLMDPLGVEMGRITAHQQFFNLVALARDETSDV